MITAKVSTTPSFCLTTYYTKIPGELPHRPLPFVLFNLLGTRFETGAVCTMYCVSSTSGIKRNFWMVV